MSARQVRPGDLLIVGLPGKELDADSRALLAEVRPAGVILLPKNIDTEEKLDALMAELAALLPETLFFLDAEGGRVDRLRRLLGPAPAAADLATRPPIRSERAGRWVGSGLRTFGFDVDFAPVVDLDHGRENNALDRRTLGRSPRSVIARGRRFLAGLQAAGVGGCLKHFPGLGAAEQDTHFAGTVIRRSRRELERDLAPFRALAAEAGAVMVSHAAYPSIDPAGRPADLSPAVVETFLRRELGFDEIIFTDDLDMHALEVIGAMAERVEAALVAGCDALAICHSLAEVPSVVDRLAKAEHVHRLRASAMRWERYRQRVRALRTVGETPSRERIRTELARLGNP